MVWCTKEVLEDPAKAPDGYTYERLAIEEWYSLERRISDAEEIESRVLNPDVLIRRYTEKWREQEQGEVLSMT